MHLLVYPKRNEPCVKLTCSRELFMLTSTKNQSKELLGLYLTKILIRQVGFLRICFNLQLCTMATHKFQGAKMMNPSTAAASFYQLICTLFTKNKCENDRTVLRTKKGTFNIAVLVKFGVICDCVMHRSTTNCRVLIRQ